MNFRIRCGCLADTPYFPTNTGPVNLLAGCGLLADGLLGNIPGNSKH